VQFVSHQGTCKESLLWFGPENRSERRASVQTASGWIDLTASGMTPPSGTLAAGQTLHEPDPAVIRAGALAELCSDLGAHLFDPQIAYLVAPGAGDHPLTASFVIHEVHRFSLKQLNRRLQALEIGEVELKKRGFPNQPESLRPRLKLVKGGSKAVIFFTRRGREHLMLIASRAAATPPDPPRSVANEGSPTQ
jgi:hypothetical protein